MAKLGSTLICGNLSVTGEIFSTNLTIDNNESIYGIGSDGNRHGMLRINDSNQVILGNSNDVTKIYSNTNKIYQVDSQGANLGFIVHSGLYGHGKGIDADTIDGRHWSSIESNFVKKSGDTMTGDLYMDTGKRFIGAHNFGFMCRTSNGGTDYVLYIDASDYVHVGYNGRNMKLDSLNIVNKNNNKVWHEDNDGHNSGLDADTLDGHHWSDVEGNYVKKSGDTMTGDLNVNAKVKANEYKIKDKVSIQFNTDNNAIEFIAL